jgi:hypothetical protein
MFLVSYEMNLVFRGLEPTVYETLMKCLFSREWLWLLTIQIKYLFTHSYLTMFHRLYKLYNGRSK